MTKKQLGLITIVIFTLGYYLGQKNSTTETIYVSKTKKSEILKCREEFEELKSQCAMVEDKFKGQEGSVVDTSSASASLGGEAKSTWIKLGKRAVDIAFEADVKDFLKQVEVPNLFEVLKNAKVVGDDQLKLLNGNFSGNVMFDDRGKDTWDVEVNINGSIDEGEPKGNKLIVLSKNGKIFPTLKELIKEEFNDEISGEHFLVLKQK